MDWTTALDELEAAVAATERILQDPPGPPSAASQPAGTPVERWSPPLPTGTLPPEARQRAVALAAAQERVIRRLEEARLDVSRQLQAVSSVPGIGESSPAVYLDVNG